jgi:hypothetical protein
MLNKTAYRISSSSKEEWALKGLLTILILYHSNYGMNNYAQFGLSIFMLIVPNYWNNRYLWTVMSVIEVLFLSMFWFSLDDHFFLFGFLTFSVAIYSWTKNIDDLKKAFAVYLSFVMGFAACYKMFFYPEYGTGNFLLYATAFDPRFASLALILGVDMNALSNEVLAAYNFADPKPSNLKIKDMFAILEWSIVILESLLCVFYFPWSKNLTQRFRSPTLMIFLVFIYLITPVLGFAHSFCLIGGLVDEKMKVKFFILSILLIIFLLMRSIL